MNKLIQKINLIIPEMVPVHLDRNNYFAVVLETIETGQEPRESGLLSRELLDRILERVKSVCMFAGGGIILSIIVKNLIYRKRAKIPEKRIWSQPPPPYL